MQILTDNLQILQPECVSPELAQATADSCCSRGAGLSEDVKGATELASVKLAIGTDCGDGELVDISKEAIKPINERDEAYQLDIQETDAVITACSALGLFRGMTTFEQLVYALPPDSSTHQSSKRKRSKCSENSCDTTRFIQNTPISIKDEPAFPWRGILMDTSRNFFEVCTIKKNILAASFAKLFVLSSGSMYCAEQNTDLSSIGTSPTLRASRLSSDQTALQKLLSLALTTQAPSTASHKLPKLSLTLIA